MRKLAREAVIFCLLGSVLGSIGIFVVMERSDRAAGRAAAMSAVHAFKGGWVEIRTFTVPPDPKMEPSINVVDVPLTNREVLSVRQCPDLSQKVLPGYKPYNPTYEQEHNCRYFFYPFAKDGGALVSVPLGNPDQISIEKDYWAANKTARRRSIPENLMTSGLVGLQYGFPAGFGVWCLYRLVRFAIVGQTGFREMDDNRKLPDGVELVKEDIFWPEGRWSFRRDNLVWGRTSGAQKYYEVRREDSHFKTEEEAMAAWENSPH